MPRSLSIAQVRRLDQLATSRYKIPALLLMDNAGRCVAEQARKILGSRGRRIIVLAGGGSNGGDGVTAARYLQGWGYSTEVLWIKNPGGSGAAAAQDHIARRVGVKFRSFLGLPAHARIPQLKKADLLIDALLGTGTRGHLRVPMYDAIACINHAGKPVLSVDIPSGVNADTGAVLDVAVKARWTVTLVAPKTGLLKPIARPYVGKLLIADIGIPNTK
jgi:hydroxyethylthiazole kinase-like uncharacterized protein yjeF